MLRTVSEGRRRRHHHRRHRRRRRFGDTILSYDINITFVFSLPVLAGVYHGLLPPPPLESRPRRVLIKLQLLL